jgi:hypothetical protein
METALEVDEEMHLCIVFSSFASVSARVFAMRKLELQMVNSDKLEFTAHEIQNCEERLHKIVEKGVISSSNTPHVDQCVSVLLTFEAEVACRMKEWQLIPKVVQVRIPSSLACWGFSDQFQYNGRKSDSAKLRLLTHSRPLPTCL